MSAILKIVFCLCLLLNICHRTRAMDCDDNQKQNNQRTSLELIESAPRGNTAIQQLVNAMLNNRYNVIATRNVMLDICHNVTKFYRWAFNPTALIIYDNELVDTFYSFFIQLRTIMLLEFTYPVVPGGVFQQHDCNWHLTVDLSEASIHDFKGSHNNAAVVHETYIRLNILSRYLCILLVASRNDILKNGIKICLTLCEKITYELKIFTMISNDNSSSSSSSNTSLLLPDRPHKQE